jgi:ArsR family transcriptional regulator, arsenate/arsenite/antimonite-responsive transcriptional repressor
MRRQSKIRRATRTEDISLAARLFRALSDPQRLRLLALISRASPEICVCDLNTGVSLVQPTVSHHLRVLKDAGLVTSQRRATWMYYRLADGAKQKVRGALTALFSQKAQA